MPFESQITQLSTDQLDRLFDATPDTTPTADTLAVGKESPKDEPLISKSQPGGLDNIPFLEDEAEDETEPVHGKDKEDNKPAEDKSTKANASKVKDDAVADDIHPDGTKPDDSTTGDSISNVNEILKNTVEYLVKSGKWVDFEGREDLDIDEEVYADLVKKQDDYRVSNMFNEMLDSTGEYGKAIISHIKGGGNPDEIIDLFKEQKQISQIDTSSESGKQTLIEKYYTDILGWKPEKVTKTVKRLITDNEIDSEFTDVKEMYNEHYQKELDTLTRENKQKELDNINKQKVFVTNIQSALDADSTLSTREKSAIAGSILDFRHKLDNGQKVNDFYIKFAEKQADPKEYVDLVRFVMDKKGYLASISKTESTKANASAFNFIKGNAAISKATNSQITINGNPDKARQGTDFSFALKNKK